MYIQVNQCIELFETIYETQALLEAIQVNKSNRQSNKYNVSNMILIGGLTMDPRGTKCLGNYNKIWTQTSTGTIIPRVSEYVGKNDSIIEIIDYWGKFMECLMKSVVMD